MTEPRNQVVQVRRFGDADGLEVVDAPMPTAGQGEVRVHVLASGIECTDVLIRRHLYPQTMRLRPPLVMGHDVIGEIDQLGEGVRGSQLGDRVADMTVVGSNVAYRTLRADRLTRAPADLDAAEAATLVLSWTTAYQLLHRAARVQGGRRVLVQGAAGAVGQALLVLGKMAGLELWGTAGGTHGALIRELGGAPIDYQREDFVRVVPGGFDVVFDGIAKDGYRRSSRAGLLCAYGYSAGVQAQRRMVTTLMWIAHLYLWRWLPGGKRGGFYSINIMRARHPAWFREDLERLFGLLATRAIQPRVAERISLDQVSRHTAVSKQAVSRASSSCARISHRNATCAAAARAYLPATRTANTSLVQAVERVSRAIRNHCKADLAPCLRTPLVVAGVFGGRRGAMRCRPCAVGSRPLLVRMALLAICSWSAEGFATEHGDVIPSAFTLFQGEYPGGLAADCEYRSRYTGGIRASKRDPSKGGFAGSSHSMIGFSRAVNTILGADHIRKVILGKWAISFPKQAWCLGSRDRPTIVAETPAPLTW